jgi:predicted GIY-YIG superfamily endonuclease
MPHIVYLIVSEKGYYFTGHTPDVELCLADHNEDTSHATKHGHSWRIVHTEECQARGGIMNLEELLKRHIGPRCIEVNVAGWLVGAQIRRMVKS